MSDPLTRLEAGDSRLWTITYSTAPASGPSLAFFVGSGNGVLVSSATMQRSSDTDWYRFFTLPDTRVLWCAEFVASFSNGAVIDRQLFRVVKTTAN